MYLTKEKEMKKGRRKVKLDDWLVKKVLIEDYVMHNDFYVAADHATIFFEHDGKKYYMSVTALDILKDLEILREKMPYEAEFLPYGNIWSVKICINLMICLT